MRAVVHATGRGLGHHRRQQDGTRRSPSLAHDVITATPNISHHLPTDDTPPAKRFKLGVTTVLVRGRARMEPSRCIVGLGDFKGLCRHMDYGNPSGLKI